MDQPVTDSEDRILHHHHHHLHHHDLQQFFSATLNRLPLVCPRFPITPVIPSTKSSPVYIRELDFAQNIDSPPTSSPNPSTSTQPSAPSPSLSSSDSFSSDSGYEICGVMNKYRKPCQRIGKCPFHSSDPGGKASPAPCGSHKPRGPYRTGWRKDEHIRFLYGLQLHGRGSWKDISMVVGTRSPAQTQAHAHRYFMRQMQAIKNKKSIHDLTLNDALAGDSLSHIPNLAFGSIDDEATEDLEEQDDTNIERQTNYHHYDTSSIVDR